jgi:hypothetical protein
MVLGEHLFLAADPADERGDLQMGHQPQVRIIIVSAEIFFAGDKPGSDFYETKDW